MLPEMLPVVLVHGGMYEGMTPNEFWADTGVLGELRAKHLKVLAPRRPTRPRSWDEERQALLDAMDAAGYERVALVGASNGCSVAARLALDSPERVERLIGGLELPVVVFPSLIENQVHQRKTLMGLLATVPGAFLVPGSSD